MNPTHLFISAFFAGVSITAAGVSLFLQHSPHAPITCPEGSVCYRTDDHTIWEFSECVLDFNNNLIVCKLVEGKITPSKGT